MTLKVGDYVEINIKRPSRWSADHVQAFNSVRGFIREIKPDNGNNNVLVDFPEDILTQHNRHGAFHFLAEDLSVYTGKKTVPFGLTQNRVTICLTYPSLLALVEGHNWTLTWDTTSKQLRGCVWTSTGDGLIGTFVLGNYGVSFTKDTGKMVEWW